MKWHVRRFSDGTKATLQKLIQEGLGAGILPVQLISKYFNTCKLYLQAYEEGVSLVEAESWVKKHKSHRGYSKQMDENIVQLYTSQEDNASGGNDSSSKAIDAGLQEDDEDDHEDLQEEDIDVMAVDVAIEGDGDIEDERNSLQDEEDKEDEEAAITQYLEEVEHSLRNLEFEEDL